MNSSLLRKLRDWRNETAKKEGVELFRVLSNKTLADIAALEPKSKVELTNIKGIKDKKYYSYGREIISIVKSCVAQTKISFPEKNKLSTFETLVAEIKNNELNEKNKKAEINQDEKIYSVSGFLDYLNEKLSSTVAKVKGEVTSLDEREKVIYFGLKDKNDESIINCLIFRYQYEVSGVKLEIGNEIIVHGYSEIYKPYGRLSLKTSLIELAGEGVLKKAYDQLKNKLEEEGLFSAERKKSLPLLPQTIGLITSSQGAAIGDFTTNLGNYGFKIKFINSSVEGKQAVFDLIRAIKQFQKMENIDALAIVRGGGSLESLQAFNNETLVREVANLEIPVVCGVGHDKDVSLVSLVSDLAVSTPTAAARIISKPWDAAVEKINRDGSFLINAFEKKLYASSHKINTLSFSLSYNFENIIQKFSAIKIDFMGKLEKIKYSTENLTNQINHLESLIINKYGQLILKIKEQIYYSESIINFNNPERQLKLGYSIISLKGIIVKSIRQIKKGDIVDVNISDGKINSEVINIKK
ncbi:exodeoxyribonuclease VII large subunit [Patescibacteria group bacterium]|nr:exodeoxyribonuclease VII large subunit [Patescibacteria group bacterium]